MYPTIQSRNIGSAGYFLFRFERKNFQKLTELRYATVYRGMCPIYSVSVFNIPKILRPAGEYRIHIRPVVPLPEIRFHQIRFSADS